MKKWLDSVNEQVHINTEDDGDSDKCSQEDTETNLDDSMSGVEKLPQL